MIASKVIYVGNFDCFFKYCSRYPLTINTMQQAIQVLKEQFMQRQDNYERDLDVFETEAISHLRLTSQQEESIYIALVN